MRVQSNNIVNTLFTDAHMKIYKLNYIQDDGVTSAVMCPVCAGTGEMGNIFSSHCKISLNHLEIKLPQHHQQQKCQSLLCLPLKTAANGSVRS